MHDQQEGRSTRSTTGGSAGTPGRAGRDQDENARVADTSPGDVRTGGQATVGRQGGPGMEQTAAERGTSGFEEIPGMTGRTGTWMGDTQAKSRAPERSEERGMEYVSGMIREAHEEGDPEFQRREEELHARQQDLGRREASLREREGQLQSREQDLRERRSRFTVATGEEEDAPPGTSGQHWRGEPWAKNPKVGGRETETGTSGQHWRGEDMPVDRAKGTESERTR
jgi:hypothetical protein